MSRYIDADKFLEENEGAENSGWSLRELIDNFPTADVRENVHAEWIFNHMSQLWECSNCHKEEIRTTDFCPKCGADMRGEKDEV